MRRMMSGAVLVILSMTAAAPVAAQEGDTAQKVEALIKQADELYLKRSTDKITRQMIGLLKKAHELDSKGFEVNWRLARGYFWLCDNTEDGATDKTLGWKGLHFARAAILADKKRVEGHYFAALCIGEYSKGLGIITALRKGIEGKFRGYLDRAMRINRSYEDGGADRAYGNFWHVLPWPKKDNEKSLKSFKKALSYNTTLPRTHFYMARVYLDEDDKAAAKRHINKCLSVDPKKGDKMDNYRYQWHCKKFKKEHGL